MSEMNTFNYGNSRRAKICLDEQVVPAGMKFYPLSACYVTRALRGELNSAYIIQEG